MAKNRIKGITIEIGGDTSGLDKALKDVNKSISSTRSDLRDVERLLKLDPKNTELLSQKFKLLNGNIENTEKKLDELKEAEKQVQEQVKKGKASEEQYDALRREIIYTENSLEKLKSEAKKTSDVLNGIEDDAIKDISKAADDAKDSMKAAEKSAASFGDVLKAGALVEGGKAVVSTLKDMAEESKEYMKIMASLEVSSERAGYGAQETEEIYRELYGVLADDQSAATTTANLQAIGVSQEKLTEFTKAAIGAWATYGDSIPIDGLSEAMNETIKTGQVTGTFADVLNWAGVSEDEFNEKLANCTDSAERADLVLQELSNQGLIEAGEAWQENNEALVENNEAQAELQEQIATFGEKVLPIFTAITETIADMIGWFNGLDGQVQAIIMTLIALVAAIGPITTAINGVGSAMNFLLANPVVALIAAIVGLVVLIATKGDEIKAILNGINSFFSDIFSKDFTETFGVLGNVINGFFDVLEDIWGAIKKIFEGIIDFIGGVFSGNWEKAWKGIVSIFEGIWDGLVAVLKVQINLVIGFINALISGVESAVNFVIGALNTLSFDIPDWVPLIGGSHFGFDIPEADFGRIPYFAKGGVLQSGSAVVGEAGPELLTMMGNQAIVQPLTNQTTENRYLGGVNIVVYGAPGQDVEELAELVSEKISDVADRKEVAFG